MHGHLCSNTQRLWTRRELLTHSALGIGGLGLATLLHEAGLAADAGTASPLAARQPHFTPKAKRVIQIFCEGGPSQVDTFDPKPALAKYDGKQVEEVVKDYGKNASKITGDLVGGNRLGGKLKGSPFAFSKHGQCGMEISELFPKLATHADDLCVIRSMRSKSSVHEVAQVLMNTGDFASVRPSLGAWTVYGLGTENESLPALVSLSAGGTAAGGDRQWGNAFLPVWCGGTGIPTRDMSVAKMIEHVRSGTTSLREQRRQIDLLKTMHDRYAAKHPEQTILDGRIQAFETAFRMQVEAVDAFDLTREPKHIRELYGDTGQGPQLLLARRLVERGVRFVQVHHNGWDTHDLNDERHRELAAACDQPLHALLTDLKQRDMLKDTLVIWGGEFGRTPTADGNDVAQKKGIGRDHHPSGFTIWMAGGGARPGTVYGGTDEFGGVAIENAVSVHDLHATILHLLGFDHERLTYRYAGRDFRLTDVHGHVVQGVLA
jgi:hypothetical protein